MNRFYELEVDDPDSLPELTDFEVFKRMKDNAGTFNVADIRAIFCKVLPPLEPQDYED